MGRENGFFEIHETASASYCGSWGSEENFRSSRFSSPQDGGSVPQQKAILKATAESKECVLRCVASVDRPTHQASNGRAQGY